MQRLAEYQATTIDDWRDAEPGKIPHELRVGELAHLHKVPHTPYYGTADATILYLIVLHEAWKWTGDAALLRQHLETARRCLEWIDTYGDLDGDGFQEYRKRGPQGYENMGWKDSGDAVVYPDGSLVKQPKALIELQGYVFDAWMRMAEVFSAVGEPARAEELRTARRSSGSASRTPSGARSLVSTHSRSVPTKNPLRRWRPTSAIACGAAYRGPIARQRLFGVSWSRTSGVVGAFAHCRPITRPTIRIRTIADRYGRMTMP